MMIMMEDDRKKVLLTIALTLFTVTDCDQASVCVFCVSVSYQVAATKGKYFDCIGFMRHGGFLVGPIKHYLPIASTIRYDSVSPDSYHLPHPADTLLKLVLVQRFPGLKFEGLLSDAHKVLQPKGVKHAFQSLKSCCRKEKCFGGSTPKHSMIHRGVISSARYHEIHML